MKIINEISSLKTLGKKQFGIVIGNFDGFHLGHQKIISQMLGYCRTCNITLVVMTFVPHPRFVLRKENQFLINDYQSRRKLMQKAGVEILYEIKFTHQFSNLHHEHFLHDYALKDKAIKCFFMGHDFYFGKDKKGDRTFVEKYCREKGVYLKVLDEFKKETEKISSSHIRSLLKQGNIKKANALLGREFFLSGTVVHGLGRGKKIGLPTANLNLKEELLIPACSVYATRVIYGGKSYLSLTNIGLNPTFKGATEITIETHILDFKEDIYGEEINIGFIEKIREEKKFQSLSELKKQIESDIVARRS